MFTAKKTPDSCKKQEELKRAASRASTHCVLQAQPVTAHGQRRGQRGGSVLQHTLPSRKQLIQLEGTHKSTVCVVTPGHYVPFPRLGSAPFLRRRQKLKFSDFHGQNKAFARKSFVVCVSFIRYLRIFFAMLRLELGTKNSPVCHLFPFPK